MKYCVTTFATQGAISPQALMPQLRAFGYDGIELWSGDLSGEDFLSWYRRNDVHLSQVWPEETLSEDERTRLGALKALADQHDLAIPMISPYFDFTAGEQRWEESLAGDYAGSLRLIVCLGRRKGEWVGTATTALPVTSPVASSV